MLCYCCGSRCAAPDASSACRAGEYGAPDESESGSRTTSSAVPTFDASLALRLPAQTRLRGLLEDDMREDRVRRFSRQGLLALAHVRGADGDWSESAHADLEGLAQMLAAGARTAELTQMATDPYFLQRRLALGSHRHLLHDLDICQTALEQVVADERFEKRSAASGAALSRRQYVQQVRDFIEKNGPNLEGPGPARNLFKTLQDADANLSLGTASVRPLVLRFNAFVRASREWLDLVTQPLHRPFEVLLPLRQGPTHAVIGNGQAEEAAEGLRVELGQVLVINTARLQVVLFESPEISEESQVVASSLLSALSHVCVCVCVCVCMNVCTHVCMHACMYVYMYVCACVCVCVFNVPSLPRRTQPYPNPSLSSSTPLVSAHEYVSLPLARAISGVW